MEKRTYCVYQIYNKVEDKSYIGCTCHFDKRIKVHKKGNQEWQIDFATHPENWIVTILEDNISDKEAQYKEIYYIDLYDAIDNGYNKIRHGNSTTLEARKKLSISISGENNPNYGKHFSEELRKKISQSLKGKPAWNKGLTGIFSEETIQRIKDTFKSNYKKENHPNYGKHLSEQTRHNISEANKGKHAWNKGLTGIFSEETLQHLSEVRKNISEETRQKMRDAKKNYIPWNKGNKTDKEKWNHCWVVNENGDTTRILITDLQKYIDLGYQKGRKYKKCQAS